MGWMKTSEALTKLPELIIKGRLSFNFDGVPLIAKKLSLKKRMNLVKVGMDRMLRSNRAHGLPPIIHLETTNVCNLKCPLCPTGSNSLNRPKGFMSMETFKRVLDELEDVLISVYLFCFGEPFLNKELPQMIEACTARNILTLTSTNGNCLQTLDEALRVVDAGLSAMIIAIDGSTQEIYQSYRKGGDVEKVKRCTALIEEAKARRGSKFPYTAARCVVTRENMDDLPNLERLASDLGVNMFTYKSLGCLVNSEKFKDYEPTEKDMRRFEYSGSSKNGRHLIECPFPFRQPIVFWDGTVVGCEYDNDLKMAFGKIGEKNFIDIWNSPKALKLRRSIREGHDLPGFCSHCPYEDRVLDGTALFCKELRPLGDI
jgi:radical SAM protein with 4Fe4S-binding SPASM domain